MNDPIPDHRLSVEAIAEAAATIDPVFLHSPIVVSETLDRRLECSVVMKNETDNPIRSFKGRGADYFLSKITERGDDRALVCASTGNFGQAMAYACRTKNRSLIVYADRNANPVKIDRIRELGAEVRLAGDDFDAAKEAAKEFCTDSGSWMIEDGREPEISEGAGTLSLELLEARPGLDTILLPLGNGALLNGNARWLRAQSNITVVGVSAEGADAMEKSWRTGSIVQRESVDTISEGIAVRVPVPEAVADMDGLVDDVLLVDDDRTIEAMRLLHDHTGIAVEPAAAVGIAALIEWPGRFSAQMVGTVLTGANLTPEQASRWLGPKD